MRPAQVATELVGFAVTTGRLMMSSTEGALVVVFAMSLISLMMVTLDIGTCGWPSRTKVLQVASINFIGLCASLAPGALAGGMRMVERPMLVASAPGPSPLLEGAWRQR